MSKFASRAPQRKSQADKRRPAPARVTTETGAMGTPALDPVLELGRIVGNREVGRRIAGGTVRREVGLEDPTLAAAVELANGNQALQGYLVPLLQLYPRNLVEQFLGAFPAPTMSRQCALDLIGFLDSGGTLAAAQWAATIFPNDAATLRRLCWTLLDHPLADVQWAMGLAANEVDDAVSVLTFLGRWAPKGAAAENAARAEATSGGLAGLVNAEAVLIVLEKYNFDPALRDWVKGRTDEIAEARVEAEKQQAATAREAAIEKATEGMSKADLGRVGNKPKGNDSKKLKDFRKAKSDAAVAETQAKLVAEGKQGQFADESKQQFEDWIAQNTPVAGAGPARWCLQEANEPGPLASAYLEFFRGGRAEPQAQALVQWAVSLAGKSPDALTKLAGRVGKAIADGLPVDTAKEAVSWAREANIADSLFNRVVAVVAPRTAEWPALGKWLKGIKASLDDAIKLLETAVTAGVTLPNLTWLMTGEKRKMTDVKWAIEKAGSTDRAIIEKFIDVVELTKSTTKADDILDAGATTEQAVRLLKSYDPAKANPEKVSELLAVATVTAQMLVDWLDVSKVLPADLYKYLVTESLPTAKLTTVLGLCKSEELEALIQPGKLGMANPTLETSVDSIILALGKLGNNATLLKQLMANHSGSISPTMVRIVDAHNSIGMWTGNAANVSTILYHYDKHVIDENGGGGPNAKSVEQYSNDTVLPLPRWNNASNDWNDAAHTAWKIRGQPGGIYDAGNRRALSFWYVSI